MVEDILFGIYILVLVILFVSLILEAYQELAKKTNIQIIIELLLSNGYVVTDETDNYIIMNIDLVLENMRTKKTLKIFKINHEKPSDPNPDAVHYELSFQKKCYILCMWFISHHLYLYQSSYGSFLRDRLDRIGSKYIDGYVHILCTKTNIYKEFELNTNENFFNYLVRLAKKLNLNESSYKNFLRL